MPSKTITQKNLTIALMDPPYESENLTTAFRILDVMARRGHNINVFAYEGASGLAFTKQVAHPNPVHGKNLAEENHPTTKDQVAALLALASKNGGKVDWVNCGMCVAPMRERTLARRVFVVDYTSASTEHPTTLTLVDPGIPIARA